MTFDLEATTIVNAYKLFAVSLFVFLAFGSCVFNGYYAFAQTDQTASNLQTASTAVEQAFNAVLAAEKAGANVTGLLAQLNLAGGVLAQAENSYRTGNFIAAITQADSVLPIAQGVMASAQNAKQTASISGQNAFWFTIAFTEIGASAFVLVLFLVWQRVKRGYEKKLRGLKPEVVEDTA